MKIQLVDNWRDVWKKWSVQILGIIGLVEFLQANIAVLDQFLPDGFSGYLAVVGMIAAYVKQNWLTPKEPVE